MQTELSPEILLNLLANTIHSCGGFIGLGALLCAAFIAYAKRWHDAGILAGAGFLSIFLDLSVPGTVAWAVSDNSVKPYLWIILILICVLVVGSYCGVLYLIDKLVLKKKQAK